MLGLNRRALLAASAAVIAAPHSRTQAQERRAVTGDQTLAASAKVATFVVSFRYRAPLAARGQNIHERIHDLAYVHCALVAAAFGGRNQGLDELPFLVG
jgi:hypothetical protein